MQSKQMKSKLNCLLKPVCSKYVTGTCIKEFKIKSVDVQREYFTPSFTLTTSTLYLIFDREIFQIK